MPLPKPSSNEDKNDFMQRCMSNSRMKDEYPDQAQRYAVCSTQWNKKGKR